MLKEYMLGVSKIGVIKSGFDSRSVFRASSYSCFASFSFCFNSERKVVVSERVRVVLRAAWRCKLRGV